MSGSGFAAPRDVSCAPIPDRPSVAAAGVPMRVLYLADRPEDAALMRDFAGVHGGLVLTIATTVDDAAHLARELSPSLVLLDLDAGCAAELGGTVTRLRGAASRPSLPIVVLSSSVNPRERESARSLGLTGFVAKPLDLDELAGALDDVARSALP